VLSKDVFEQNVMVRDKEALFCVFTLICNFCRGKANLVLAVNF
jgi:hypothetical protein